MDWISNPRNKGSNSIYYRDSWLVTRDSRTLWRQQCTWEKEKEKEKKYPIQSVKTEPYTDHNTHKFSLFRGIGIWVLWDLKAMTCYICVWYEYIYYIQIYVYVPINKLRRKEERNEVGEGTQGSHPCPESLFSPSPATLSLLDKYISARVTYNFLVPSKAFSSPISISYIHIPHNWLYYCMLWIRKKK